MIPEHLQDCAAFYVSGAMSAPEREQFELALESHEQLRRFVAQLADAGTSVLLSGLPPCALPSPALKTRLLTMVQDRSQSVQEGCVRCGPDGLVEWINPAFSAMCGYALEEVAGRKLGPLLQGKKTDRETAERMRRAVHECRPCSETILNYHKNGTPYWVQIAIEPILDDCGKPHFFVARERELPEMVIP